MSRPGALPPWLAATQRVRDARCAWHCDGPARGRPIASPLPGLWQVYACPSGVVSVVTYAEWGEPIPFEPARAYLARHTVPPSLVRRSDLRLASRHGPELGTTAERKLRRPGMPPLRVVYWRVYPFKARDGSDRRLFVCRRPRHTEPVFYAAPPQDGARQCPVCRAGRPKAVRRRQARPRPPVR